VPIAHETPQAERVQIVPHFRARDPLTQHIALVLQAEVESSEDMASRLYADVLANALAVHFLSRYAASRQTVRESTGGLSLYKLRRTTEYINEHVERDLSLTELAAVAHTSLAHFARLFRQATGLMPHQYVIVCRIEHAKRFLAETELPIIDIAHRVGFADQSHFTALVPKSHRADGAVSDYGPTPRERHRGYTAPAGRGGRPPPAGGTVLQYCLGPSACRQARATRRWSSRGLERSCSH
jgi:AraC-like DNA-binding protein